MSHWLNNKVCEMIMNKMWCLWSEDKNLNTFVDILLIIETNLFKMSPRY